MSTIKQLNIVDEIKGNLLSLTDKQGKINLGDLENLINNIANKEKIEKEENICYTEIENGNRLDKSLNLVWHPTSDVVIGAYKGRKLVGLALNEILVCESNSWKYLRSNIIGNLAKTIESELAIDEI